MPGSGTARHAAARPRVTTTGRRTQASGAHPVAGRAWSAAPRAQVRRVAAHPTFAVRHAVGGRRGDAQTAREAGPNDHYI